MQSHWTSKVIQPLHKTHTQFILVKPISPLSLNLVQFLSNRHVECTITLMNTWLFLKSLGWKNKRQGQDQLNDFFLYFFSAIPFLFVSNFGKRKSVSINKFYQKSFVFYLIGKFYMHNVRYCIAKILPHRPSSFRISCLHLRKRVIPLLTCRDKKS